MNKKVIGALSILIVTGILTGCEQTQQQAQNTQQPLDMTQDATTQEEYKVDASDNVKPHTLIGDIEKSELSESEKAGLILMREEEKLARDVYLTLYDKWGQNIFQNIAKSEQTHTDTVKFLLDKYGIADPVTSDEIGVFTSPEMQKLYDELITKGSTSLVDALTVGTIVEDLDISDLEKLLKETDNEDIQIAYQNLNKGSRNHLRAFVRQLEKNGETYTPQYITQEMYDQIIAGEQERGNVNAQGNGQGRGQGNGGGRGMNRTQ